MRFSAAIYTALLILSFQAHAKQQWTTIAHSNSHRSEGTLIEYKGEIYMFNGFTFGLHVDNTIEKFNYQTNKWTLVANTFTSSNQPTAVTHNGAVLIDDDIWIIGGRIGPHPGKVSDQVWIFNIPTKKLRKGPTLPVPFAAGGAAIVNGKIHVFGGLDANADCDVATHLIYDTTKSGKGWQDHTAQSPMPLARNHFGVTTLSGKIYAIGGQHGHDNCAKLKRTAVDVKYVHAYDTQNNTWQRLADLPIKQSHTEPSTFVHEGKIYTVGAQLYGDKVLSYDPVKNQWKEHTNLKLRENIIAPGSRIHNNKLYVFGGGATLVTNPITDTQVIELSATPSNESPIAKYVQTGNRVVIAASKFSNNHSGKSHSWLNKNNVQPAGMINLPNTQTLYRSSNLSNSPKLSYKIKFSTPGIYYIWVHGLGDSKNGEGKDDSLHIGLNGKVQARSDNLDGYTSVWGWRNSTRDGSMAALNIPTVGVHEVNVWMREDGFAFNKLILSSDKNYNPSGNGPAPTFDNTHPVNEKPIVNAGQDTETIVNQPLFLQGSVTDDGLPNDTVTSIWSKLSGPGTVNFSAANSAVTQVRFSNVGTYVLKLEATDGALGASSNIKVLVENPNNQEQSPANLLVNPMELLFPRTYTGATSKLKVSLKNTGEKTLTLTQISLLGNNHSDFETTLPAGTTLEGGERVSLEIKFSPSKSGEKSAVLTISHNGTGNIDLIDLYGVAMRYPDPPTNTDRYVEYRLNVGGPLVITATGLPWNSDDSASPSQFITSPSHIYSRKIPITVNQAAIAKYADSKIFETERWGGNKSQGLSWAFPVTDGEYEVRLYFAEIYRGAYANGARTFDILLEDQLVESELDIFKQSGSETALVKSYFVNSDDVLNIKLNHRIQNPAIKAIEILRCTVSCDSNSEPGNKVPIVSVGKNTTVAISDTLQLNGTANDDGLPINILNYQWKMVSGPGTATFGDIHVASTTVTFDALGRYVLALEVSDTALTGQNRITVEVTDNGVPPADDGVFSEENGVLSIEAENYSAKSSTGTHNWVMSSSNAASNQKFMVTSPNSGKIVHASGSGPMLSYKVFFKTPGTKKVWIRGLGDTNSSGEGKSDSLHLGLNGKAVASADNIDIFPAHWSWSSHTRDRSPAVLYIATPGKYTINIWMREDGLKVDKILLFDDHSRTPVGTGPMESR